MKFTYVSEDDAKKAMLLPAGTYDFECIDAQDKVSKKGNEMIAVKLRVFSDNGERHVHDYLMEAMRFKLIHWAKATGLVAKYEAGEMAATDCVGRTGKVQLIQEEQEGFQPKNSVKDYLIADGAEKHVAKAAIPAPAQDDGLANIPF